MGNVYVFNSFIDDQNELYDLIRTSFCFLLLSNAVVLVKNDA